MLMAMIWPVMVVPMLAPMITPMAWVRVMRPASTKLTVMTVVALLLWISTVTHAPTRTPRKGVLVNVPISCRRRSPAMSCKASLISLMAKRKIPTPPRSWMTLCTDMRTLLRLCFDSCPMRRRTVKEIRGPCRNIGKRRGRLNALIL